MRVRVHVVWNDTLSRAGVRVCMCVCVCVRVCVCAFVSHAYKLERHDCAGIWRKKLNKDCRKETVELTPLRLLVAHS